MTTSATPSISTMTSPETPFTPRELAAYEGYAQNTAHDAVLTLLTELAGEGGVTRAGLAKKLNVNPSQISRWLGSPGNWTLKSLGLLLAAMGYVPTVGVRPINDLRRTTNFIHEAADFGAVPAPVKPTNADPVPLPSTPSFDVDFQAGAA